MNIDCNRIDRMAPRVAAYFTWLPPLVARIVVGWVFLWAAGASSTPCRSITENFRGWGIPYPENC